MRPSARTTARRRTSRTTEGRRLSPHRARGILTARPSDMDKLAPIDTLLEKELPEGFVIDELRVSDTASVSELEREVYADNPALLDPDFSAQKRIDEMQIASNISPKLSFKIEKVGALTGYIIMYQTIYRRRDGVLPEGAPCVFIADIAIRNVGSVSGARAAFFLVRQVALQYKVHYFDKGLSMPIVMSTREHTSRKLVHTVIQFIQQLGMRFEVVEGKGELTGDDMMYHTVLKPVI